ncbi:MAG: hypothetical protein FWF57_00235 [Defluviitaleaceae bacterium]|nr:hypothetical protein [Defluviitaleaceae bacterium]
MKRKKLFYLSIVVITAMIFLPFILHGQDKSAYGVWVWENSHSEIPITVELDGNSFFNTFTLVSYEGINFEMPPEDSPWYSWVSYSDYLPRVPWMTRVVNETVELVPQPEGTGINTNRGRGGMKTGFVPGANRITVRGRYTIEDNNLVLTYSNGTVQTFDIEKDEYSLTIGELRFIRR